MRLKSFDDKCLRTKCSEVSQIDDELKLNVRKMADLLLASNGYGLAAPQVGITQRFFIVMLPEWQQYKVFVNPEIISIQGKKVYAEEGCLSLPGLVVSVPRYEKIKINYFELDGREYTEVYKGNLARILQHEYEHLDGKLITDYI